MGEGDVFINKHGRWRSGTIVNYGLLLEENQVQLVAAGIWGRLGLL